MYMNTQKTPLTELLLQLDMQTGCLPSADTVFQPSSTVFYSLLQMYNSFKKQNETRILQNKIYTLNISTDDDDVLSDYNQISASSKNNVNIALLCGIHELKVADIDSLLKIKQFLPSQYARQIIIQISNNIRNISIQTNNLKLALNGFKKLLKCKECLPQNSRYLDSQLKQSLQSQMVSTILQLKLSSSDFGQIGEILFGMPHLNNKILQLISQLYEQTQHNQQFLKLQQVYHYIYNKLTVQISQSCKDQQKIQQSMIKICIPAHLQLLKQELQFPRQHQLQQPADNNITLLKLIQEEAKRKMNTDFSLLTDRVRNIIEFIFFAVLNSSTLWNDFILWRWKLPQNCKQFVNSYKLPQLAGQIFSKASNSQKKARNYEQMLLVINLLLQNQNQFQISQNFVRQLLTTDAHKFMINKNIRKFVSVKTLIDPQYVYWDIIINAKFQYIDVILEMFQFQQALEFFRKILQDNQLRSQQLILYLTELYGQKPLKFKQFFIRIDRSKNNRILEFNEYALIGFLGRKSDMNMALSIIRQINSYLPSPYCMLILTNFISVFTEGVESKIIRAQIIRSLNIILINNTQAQLNSAFKKQLKDFGQKIGNPEAMNIFQDVSEQMKDALKAFYQQAND